MGHTRPVDTGVRLSASLALLPDWECVADIGTHSCIVGWHCASFRTSLSACVRLLCSYPTPFW